MVYKATKEIAAEFDALDIKYTIHELDSSSAVKVSWNGEVAKDQTMYFISNDDDSDVHAENMAMAHVPAGKKDAVLSCLNGLNRRFRYAKFSLDDYSDVRVEYDFPLESKNAGPIAKEVFLRFMNIIDDAYPEVMKAIWS